MTRKLVWTLLCLSSLALIAGSWMKWLPISLTEVFGFITGAVCVLLVVERWKNRKVEWASG